MKQYSFNVIYSKCIVETVLANNKEEAIEKFRTAFSLNYPFVDLWEDSIIINGEDMDEFEDEE